MLFDNKSLKWKITCDCPLKVRFSEIEGYVLVYLPADSIDADAHNLALVIQGKQGQIL